MSMRIIRAVCLVLALAPAAALANDAAVVLDYRPQPDRDLTAEYETVSMTTMRVVDDRGLIAASEGRLSSSPMTMLLTSWQSVRFINGKAASDGSFPLDMRYLGRRTTVRGPDGQERLMPEKGDLNGLRVAAVIKAGGQIRDGSVVLSGADPAIPQELSGMMASMLGQITRIEPLMLKGGEDVQQEVAMKVPVPGAGIMDVKMQISNRLLKVENGIASIQQIYSFDFGAPTGDLKLSADGSGGGSMLYDVATRTLLSNESGSLMKMLLETPEGTLEYQMDARNRQSMRPTPSQVQ
jgi:hypothetical protein